MLRNVWTCSFCIINKTHHFVHKKGRTMKRRRRQWICQKRGLLHFNCVFCTAMVVLDLKTIPISYFNLEQCAYYCLDRGQCYQLFEPLPFGVHIWNHQTIFRYFFSTKKLLLKMISEFTLFGNTDGNSKLLSFTRCIFH